MPKSKKRKRRQTQTRDQNQPPRQRETLSIRTESPDYSSRMDYLIVAMREGATDEEASRRAAGLPGFYRVTFTLSTPGNMVYRSTADLSAIPSSGESLLLTPSPRPTTATFQFNHVASLIDGDEPGLQVNGVVADMEFLPGANGTLGSVSTQVYADTSYEAAKKAHNYVLPLLSWFSFQHDVALDISAYRVVAEDTGVAHWSVGLLGKPKLFRPAPIVPSDPDFARLFAIYREASNASNIFFQAISYYKVIGGTTTVRQRRKEAQVKSGSTDLRDPVEQIPLNPEDLPYEPELRRVFQPYLGQRFAKVIPTLRTTIRHAIAHLDLDSDSLNPDSYEDYHKCEWAVPVLRHIARVMLKNELKAHPQFAAVEVW
ncbi:MAG: hypothetical protein M3Q29_00735 [Chloroflexota bacterium]|nr:hypothetical protein [Chloroflexota bacterium]